MMSPSGKWLMVKTADLSRRPSRDKQEVGTANTSNFKREMNTLTFLSVQTSLNKDDGL